MNRLFRKWGGGMKQVVNFILAGLVLLLASVWFPTYVYVADFKTLIISTLLLFVAEILVVILIFAMIVAMALASNFQGVITGVVAVFFAEIIALSLLDAWMPGLAINGFMAKLLLAVALAIFRIPDKN